MNITKGIIAAPVKTVLYGVEGIGKSTFASKFPEPLFFDLDHGTKRLDVSRVEDINSWPMLLSCIKEVYEHPYTCKTLVIDTADAAERLCISYICGKYGKKGIEDFGYGNGYTYLKEEMENFLFQLECCIAQGINVVILAHAILKTITPPDDMGSYDHWELKLSTKTTNQVAPMFKEWADLLIFANYKMYLVTDEKTQKKKATGGKRMMWTSHTPFADAKNRFDLETELPFDYGEIARLIPNNVEPAVKPAPEQTKPAKQLQTKPAKQAKVPTNTELEKLYTLMKQDKVTAAELQKVVASRGYFPADMPIEKYPVDFVNGVLIAAWSQVVQVIKSIRK